MTVVDLERWVEQNRALMSSVGVTADFGRGPNLGRKLPRSTWISFSSSWARGRYVLSSSGETRVDAFARGDGTPLLSRRSEGPAALPIDEIVNLLAGEPPTTPPAPPAPASDGPSPSTAPPKRALRQEP
jgi:hypothetical protein